MSRALSVDNVLNAKFNTLKFDGIWYEAIGNPELSGSWFIKAPTKHGKTSLAMQLAKYLTKFGRVGYNSVEEGVSLSIQEAYNRVNMKEVAPKVLLLDKETVPELIVRLDKPKSPSIVFIDTIQFWDLKFGEYKELKSRYPHKLFIYISHQDGRNPDGHVAKRIWRDANVIFEVEGFKAFVTGRYGGNPDAEIIINEERAARYWGLKMAK